MNTSKNSPSRALVISGGGARGAWGVGVAKGLSKAKNNHYNLVVGTSTGSLMGPLVLLRDFKTLSNAYTSVTQDSIFNVNPFCADGSIRYLLFAYRLICGKKTLGETENLLKLIKKFFKESDYQKILDNKWNFGAAVTSLTSNTVKVESIQNNSYEDMKEWMWASANEPVFMTTVNKDGEAWVDGGLKNYLPISYAIEQGADEIDVIIHNGLDFADVNWKQTGGIMDLLLRTISIFKADVGESDVTIAKLQAIVKDTLQKEVTLNLYFMSPKQVQMTQNELIFDEKIMKALLKEGYDSVVNDTIITKSYPLLPLQPSN